MSPGAAASWCATTAWPNRTQTPDVWLVFAPVKKTPADYLTQKATELGVRALQPVLTRRTMVRRVNDERMRANAIEAAEQSGRRTVPQVRAACDLDKLLATWPADRRLLFCDEAGEAPPIAAALAARAGRNVGHPDRSRRRLRSGRTRRDPGAAVRHAGLAGPAHPACRYGGARRPGGLAGAGGRLALAQGGRVR